MKKNKDFNVNPCFFVFSDFNLGFNCFERIAHHKAIKIAFKENPIDINNAQEIVNQDIREKIIERFCL